MISNPPIISTDIDWWIQLSNCGRELGDRTDVEDKTFQRWGVCFPFGEVEIIHGNNVDMSFYLRYHLGKKFKVGIYMPLIQYDPMYDPRPESYPTQLESMGGWQKWTIMKDGMRCSLTLYGQQTFEDFEHYLTIMKLTFDEVRKERTHEQA